MTRARELADLLTGGQTIATDDNTAQLTLKSTDADSVVGPVLDLVRDSSSPADDDKVGVVSFKGDDDAGNSVTFAQVRTVLKDVTDTAEDGELQLQVRRADSLVTGLFIGQTEAVFNEDGQNVDFRVESDTQTHMLFVDADSELVTIGTNIGSLFNAEGTVAALTVAGSDTSTTTIGNGGAAINISNKDGTGGNTAGIHFSREDNDGNPHFSGAAIVAQFPDDQTTGQYPKGRLHFNTSTTENAAPSTKMTLLEDGNLGIGTTSPTLDSALAGLSVSSSSTLLQIHDGDGACIKLSDPASGANRGFGIALQGTSAVISNCESGELRFGTGNTERARFDSSGRFMVGANDANSAQLTSSTSATGEFAADLRSTSSSYTSIVCLLGSNTNTTNSTYDHLRCDIHGVAQKLAIRDSGNVVNANNSYGSLSDSRMKENIVDAASQWDDIKALQVRKYNRIGETQKELGVIAQELEASGMDGLVEEARYYDVNNNPDEETRKSVKYSVLYMKAVKALQEAMTRIETLETQNTTQATQIADLITRVTALEAE